MKKASFKTQKNYKSHSFSHTHTLSLSTLPKLQNLIFLTKKTLLPLLEYIAAFTILTSQLQFEMGLSCDISILMSIHNSSKEKTLESEAHTLIECLVYTCIWARFGPNYSWNHTSLCHNTPKKTTFFLFFHMDANSDLAFHFFSHFFFL